MNQAYEDIQRNIPKLTLKEKASIAYRLLRELDGEADENVEELWLVEIERRWMAYQAGEIEAVDGDEVMARVRARLESSRAHSTSSHQQKKT